MEVKGSKTDQLGKGATLCIGQVNDVWSHVLPRSVWRFSSNKHAMGRMRVRFNRAMAKAILDLEGCYL